MVYDMLVTKNRWGIIFAFLLLSISFSSCVPEEPQEVESDLERQTEEQIHNIKDGDMEILVIDDCEYLVYKEHISSNQGFGYLAHKGNCKNPIHCYQTLEETPSPSANNTKE